MLFFSDTDGFKTHPTTKQILEVVLKKNNDIAHIILAGIKIKKKRGIVAAWKSDTDSITLGIISDIFESYNQIQNLMRLNQLKI